MILVFEPCYLCSKIGGCVESVINSSLLPCVFFFLVIANEGGGSGTILWRANKREFKIELK